MAGPVSAPGPRTHPGARTALMLGLISVVGAVFVVPLLLGPFAWYRGARVGREVEREPHRWSGGGHARTGAVLGMVASALLGLLVLVLLVVAALAVVTVGLDTGYGT